jgi:hypothetical protein
MEGSKCLGMKNAFAPAVGRMALPMTVATRGDSPIKDETDDGGRTQEKLTTIQR